MTVHFNKLPERLISTDLAAGLNKLHLIWERKISQVCLSAADKSRRNAEETPNKRRVNPPNAIKAAARGRNSGYSQTNNAHLQTSPPRRNAWQPSWIPPGKRSHSQAPLLALPESVGHSYGQTPPPQSETGCYMSLLNPVLAVGLEYWEGSNRSCSKGEEGIRQDGTLGGVQPGGRRASNRPRRMKES